MDFRYFSLLGLFFISCAMLWGREPPDAPDGDDEPQGNSVLDAQLLCGIYITMVAFAPCVFIFACDRMGKYQWSQRIGIFSKSDRGIHV